MKQLILFLLSILLSTATLFAGDGVWVKSIPVTNIGVGGMYHIMDRSLHHLRKSTRKFIFYYSENYHQSQKTNSKIRKNHKSV